MLEGRNVLLYLLLSCILRENLYESSKVPVWDVTFSVPIYYVFPNTHRSCTVPVNITFSETGSLKSSLSVLKYSPSKAGSEKEKKKKKQNKNVKKILRWWKNVFKLSFQVSFLKPFLLSSLAPPCDLFFLTALHSDGFCYKWIVWQWIVPISK